MAYSSLTQIRERTAVLSAARADIADADITNQINYADEQIRSDLAQFIDFSLVPTNESDSNFPEFLRTLSNFKSVELCLVYAFGAKREADTVDDITYWRKLYDEMIFAIKNGEVPLELPDGTSIAKNSQVFENTAKPDIAPALGMGKWGDFLDKDELAEARPLDG